MIILFDEAEVEFNTLGLGVLNDAKSGVVTEGLNDIFEFKVEYPITGSNYSKLKIGRILFAKPNPYDSMQPFRIAAITKPIKGIVSILCYHISYDTNGIPCKAIKANSLSEALQLIKENSIVDNNFDLTTDVSFSRKFETTAPYNVRALLMGDEKESLIGVYNSEIKFNKFSIILMSKRGKNRGAKVTYGCNMTDLNHETTNERLFNGVFPYYHKEQESTETVSEDTFTKAYIVGSKPFQDGWLSFSKDGDPYHPVDSTPVQIATEGEYEEKVYSWNSIYQRYDEKIYNESITLIEGIIEPSWISIDWSRFPNVVCKANAKGYFKSSTDTDWGTLKGVGDVIFEGNVLTSGLTNMANNMIIYYSEVLPPNHSSSSETTVTSVDVMLDDPIIWLSTTDAKTMKYNKILSLDLTNEFEEEPTKDKLKSKAEEYIVKNLVGTVKHTTTVSFIDLASTSEKEKYKNFDHIELGDTIQVSYKDLGVDVELRVISTEYDVIKDRYISVELGEKKNKFSGESVQNGDNISSLSNDVGYTDVTTVNKLIADTITADYLQAVNATMSKAQIEYLQVAKISCPGILEASQLVLDELVAKMLIADNAKISETLEAGAIKVAGDISITSGSINITDNGNTSFIVDREGNVTANSVSITGGTFNINDGMFEVTNDGTLYSKGAFVEGEIIATSGKIGNCTIDEEGILHVPGANINGTITAVDIVGGSINIGQIGSTSNYNFTVDKYGSVNANSLTITGGSISIGNNFEVTNAGILTAKGAEISGAVNINGGSIEISGSGGTVFSVNSNGKFEANDIKLYGGSIENLHITGNLYFENADSDQQVYLINSEGLHLPGIDATIEQTTIGPFITTANAMSTNEDKAGVLDTEPGLYMDSTGIGYYNSTTRQKVAISDSFGLYSTTMSIDVLRAYSNLSPSQLTHTAPGTKPPFVIGTSWGDPSSDKATIDVYTDYQARDNFYFISNVGTIDLPIKVNANSTRTIHWGTPGYAEELHIGRKLTIENVYVSQLYTGTNTERNVTVSWDKTVSNYWNIYVHNTATSQIKVTLLILAYYNYSSNN